jgi:exopolysaccharide biosynthesis polyprenyl glycosylphosphotransferase
LGIERRFTDGFAQAIPLEFQAAEPRLAPGHRSVLVKRLIDIVVAALLLLFLLPLLLLTAILIRLDSKGPIFFRQTRLGLGGKPFEILKFRTMTVLENGHRVVQATRNDPRITRVGGFFRRISIDELPQLINVLKGEMSLVGPRPHARAHDEYYALRIRDYTARQNVKPGITGWAQINGLRGETPTLDSMRERVNFDLWYVRNVSLVLDIEILLRTPFELLRRRNAY